MSTVYPLMLLPAIAIVFVAGITAACRPAAAGGTAGVSAITGLQVAGMAVVASRDWLNFAGADGARYQRGLIGSRLATTMAMVAVTAIVASIALYRGGRDGRQALVVRPGRVLAGAAVTVVVPLLLGRVLHQPGVTAAGQFALWWSLPWGIGLVAAGTLPTAVARRAALLSVAASVVFTLACVAASPWNGFPLRLPD